MREIETNARASNWIKLFELSLPVICPFISAIVVSTIAPVLIDKTLLSIDGFFLSSAVLQVTV